MSSPEESAVPAGNLTRFRYHAFISYSRHDERVAKKLRKLLAKRRVPAELRETVTGSSSHFDSIFLDTADAGADSSLQQHLKDALATSRKLIVICSPFAAQSEFVAEEIREFQRSGRSNDIVCLIASGLPDAAEQGKPQLDCFPPPLHEVPTPLAAAIGKESDAEWSHAVDQVAAGLCDQSLTEYLEAARRRKLRALFIAGAFASVLIAGVAWAAWAWWLPHTTYSADYVRKHGIWQPIGERDASDLSATGGYKIVRHGAYGLPVAAAKLDQRGLCTRGLESITGDEFSVSCSTSVACEARFDYVDGRLVTERIVNQFGTTVETVQYLQTPDVAVITEAVIGCSRRSSNIDFVEIERDAAGFDRKLRFKGGKDKTNVTNREYAFGVALDYSASGQVTRRTLLDATGNPMVGGNGFATIEWRYGPRNELLEVRLLGTDGKTLVDGSGGFARKVLEYGADHSVTWSFWDALGAPTVDEYGASALRVRATGGTLRHEHLDAQRKPVLGKYGEATVEVVRDRRSRLVAMRYFGTKNEPVTAGNDLCHVLESTNTDRPEGGWVQEERCLDEQSRPLLRTDGTHVKRRVFSASGQQLEEESRDIAGKPVFCIDQPKDDTGCPVHRHVVTFDNKGNASSSRFYGLDGAPTVNGQGVAGWDEDYNALNFIRKTVYVGIDGKPSPSVMAPAARLFEYDDRGRKVRAINVDAEGKPSPHPDGFTEMRYLHDDFGNVVETRSYGADGKLYPDKSGAAIYRMKYDAQGHETEKRWFNANEEPTRDDQGRYGYRITYDRFGWLQALSNLAADGNSVAVSADGVAGFRRTFDRHGRIIADDNVDVGGNTVFSKRHGYARLLFLRDERGLVLEERNLDAAGQPVTEGIATYKFKYDLWGRLIERATYGADDKLRAEDTANKIAVQRFTRDDRGRIMRMAYFDVEDKPTTNDDGAYALARRYDNRDQQVEQVQLGPDGKPVDTPRSLAIRRYEFDAFGRTVATREFHADGTVPKGDWIAVMRSVYDVYGRLTRRHFQNADGQPMLHPISGRADVRYVYDELGREMEERSLGTDEQPVNRKDTGWSVKKHRYDGFVKAHLECMDTAANAVARCNDDD